jgi:hypothetical protein
MLYEKVFRPKILLLFLKEKILAAYYINVYVKPKRLISSQNKCISFNEGMGFRASDR